MRRKILHIALLVLILGTFVVLSSCGKNTTINLLVGRWNLIKIEDLEDSTFVCEWEFTGDNALIIYQTHQGPNDQEFTRGRYVVKSYKKFEIFDEGELPKYYPDFPGTWQIVKRKDGTLRIVKDIGGLLFLEFKRV